MLSYRRDRGYQPPSWNRSLDAGGWTECPVISHTHTPFLISVPCRMERLGLQLLEPSVALAALQASLASLSSAPALLDQASCISAVSAALSVKWRAFLAGLPPRLAAAEFYSSFREQLLLQGKRGPALPVAPASAVPSSTLQQSAPRQLPAASGERQEEKREAAASPLDPSAVESQVSSVVSTALSSILGTSDVPPDAPLMSSGLDSLGAVELRNSLEGALGLSLPSTLVREQGRGAVPRSDVLASKVFFLLIGPPH